MSGIQSIREGLSGNTTRVIVVAIIITFIGSVGWAGFFSQGSANIIAKVGSKDITTTNLNFELSVQQSALSQRFPDQEIEDDLLINLSREALIGKFSIIHYLEQKGFFLPDTFIYSQLQDEEQFQERGAFSKQRFDSFARSNGFIPSDYLERVNEDLQISIWRQALFNSSLITDTEIDSSIRLAEQSRDITFLKLPKEKFNKNIIAEDQDIENYYQANLRNYMSPKKSKVAYILFNLSNLKNEINPSMDEVDIEYQDYIEAFDASERKSVSHIMLNITEARSSEVAMMEMDKIKQQISEGANFNDLILKYTEDEASKNIKGSIGVTDGTLFPPEFEDTLLTMDAGEISKPIELETSVHLLRLDEIIQPKPLSKEEKLNDFKEEIRLRQAEDNYITLIDKASDLVFSSSSIQDIAGDFKQVLNETDLFTEFDIPEDLNHQSVIDFIFTENLEGNFPEVIEISTELAVLIQVVNFEDTAQLPLDSVREKIRVAYVEEEGLRKSQEFVNTAINDLSNDKSLKTLSEEQNVSIEVYKDLKRDSSLLPPGAINQIFTLPRSGVGNVFGSSQTQSGDYLIYRLDSVNAPQDTMNEEDREQVRRFLAQQLTISELTELQNMTQQALGVEKLN